jgi:hypothetical protein
MQPSLRIWFAVALAALLTISVSGLFAQPWESRAPILPAPEPFSLNSYDVIDAVWMIRRSFALVYDDGETRRTVPVRVVRSVWVGFDPDAYENHQNRYDIELNGEPLDWDHLYIEYAGDLVNLRLLFTYRNQQPIPDVQYRIE